MTTSIDSPGSIPRIKGSPFLLSDYGHTDIDFKTSTLAPTQRFLFVTYSDAICNPKSTFNFNFPTVSVDIDLVFTSEHRERRASEGTPDSFHTAFRSGGQDVNLKFKKSKLRQDRVPFHYYENGIRYDHVTEAGSEVLSMKSLLVFIKALIVM